MIKVNLIKTKLSSQGGVTQEQSTIMGTVGTSLGSVGGDQVELFKKLGLMVILPVLLVIYEQYNVGNLNDAFKRLSNQTVQLQGQKSQKQSELQNMQSSEMNINEFQKKMEILKSLGKQRLREIKALDFIQTVIPEQVWLTEIEYPGDKFTLKGYAVTDSDLDAFIQRVESRSYFRDVVLLKSDEVKLSGGAVRQFVVQAGLEEL